jgi:hypothetical protein
VIDTVLVVAWLVLAHFVADFVLQNDWIAMNKGAGGRTGWAALSTHGLHVGICLVPVVLAFGLPGVVYLVVVMASHVAVDRWKVRATRRSEASALESARRRLASGRAPASGLGNAWTPWPGMLFLADQALHLTIAVVGWLVILAGASLLPEFVDVVNRMLRDWDRATVNAVVLWSVVLVSLFLVNTRGAFYFTMALTSPRDMPAPPAGGDADVLPVPAGAVPATASAFPVGAPARIVATTAALERFLVVAFVISGTPILAGVLVAVDALAHWHRFGDRGYVEWYLLSTMGGMLVAFGSALVAVAALSTLG